MLKVTTKAEEMEGHLARLHHFKLVYIRKLP